MSTRKSDTGRKTKKTKKQGAHQEEPQARSRPEKGDVKGDVEEEEKEEVADGPVAPSPPQPPKRAPKKLTGGEEEDFQEGFSPRTRQVLVEAKAMAERLAHGGVTTGHLIGAILAEDAGLSQDIFSDVNAFPEMFEEEMAHIPEDAIEAPLSGHWYDPHVETACLRSRDAAEVMESEQVEPEHLLLALLSLSEGTAADIMAEFSLARRDMRDELIAMMGFAVEEVPDWERGRNLPRRRRRKGSVKKKGK